MTTTAPTRHDAASPGTAPTRHDTASRGTAPMRHDTASPGSAEALRSLGCPVIGFTAQPHLAELVATTRSDRARTVGVSISYTYYRRPSRPDHLENFVDLTPEQHRAIERAQSSALPQWMIDQVSAIRFPTLWDAVRTAKAAPGDSKNALETRLVSHANDVLRARDPRHVPLRAPRAPTTGRVCRDDLLQSTCMVVDHRPQRGRLLDAGPHLVAIGARVDDRFLTVVYDTRIAPRLELEFSTHRL
jgi:hypothetical protein